MHETPKKLVEDRQAAFQAASVEVPFRELASQAKEVGNTALAHQFELSADQSSDLYIASSALLPKSHSEIISGREPDITEPIVHSQENTAYTLERLNKILGNADYALNTWMVATGGQKSFGVSSDKQGVTYTTASRTRSDLLDVVDKPDKFEKMAVVQDVPETVTFQELSENALNRAKGTPQTFDNRIEINAIMRLSRRYAQTGPMALVRYAASDTKQYPYRDAHGRRGNRARISIVLPMPEAQELFEASQTDPNILHRLLDQSAEKALNPDLHGGIGRYKAANLYQTEWQQSKPPLEEWRQSHQGSLTMAFRASMLDDFAQASIVEY
jgi:hypothetical protein